MISVDPGDRDLAAIGAALLDQGSRADGLSRLVTAAALVALMVWPAIPGTRPILLPVILGPVAALGLVELYLAIRVGFDAALLDRLAASTDRVDLDRLDRALLRLGLVPQAKAARSMEERIAGTRRLLGWQGLMLGAQALLILTGAVFALLQARSGG